MIGKILIYLLILLGLRFNSQTLNGTVYDHDTGEEIESATVLLQSYDGRKATTTTNANGKFAISKIPSGTYTLMVLCTGYHSTTIDSLTIPAKRNILVSLKDDGGRIICYETLKYICQEDDPNYEYYFKNKKTTNYTDSLGRKQGLWAKYHDRHKDPSSKFKHNQTVEMGYYKDGKKIGRWLYLKPDGKVRQVVTYDMGKVIRKNKCTTENYPENSFRGDN